MRSRVARAATSPAPSGDVAVWRPERRVTFISITLFFTIVPLLSLVSHPPALVPLALALSGWAVFGGTLLQLFRVGPVGRRSAGRFLVLSAAYLTVVALVVQVAFGVSEVTALYFYAGVTAGRLLPESRAMAAIVVVAAAAGIGTGQATGEPEGGLVIGVTVGTISLTLSALMALRHANRELQAARLELAESAVEEERIRIARDLHDTLGHSLSLIALKSELARRILPTDPARAADEITDIERTAREALASVRETVSGYREPTLAMELARARSALRAAGIEATVEPAPEDLPRDVEGLLGWAVREGVTNVMRHSGARSASIRIVSGARMRGVEVLDDGRGTPPHRDDGQADTAPSPDRGYDGFGLAGLAERAVRLGGRVDAAAPSEGGFRLFVSVPVEDRP